MKSRAWRKIFSVNNEEQRHTLFQLTGEGRFLGCSFGAQGFDALARKEGCAHLL
jgi:hypothetical protein